MISASRGLTMSETRAITPSALTLATRCASSGVLMVSSRYSSRNAPPTASRQPIAAASMTFRSVRGAMGATGTLAGSITLKTFVPPL